MALDEDGQLDELRRDQLRYRTFMERSMDGIAILESGSIRVHNSEMGSMLGRPDDSLVQRPFLEFVAEHHRERVLSMILTRESPGDHASAVVQCSLIRADGSSLHVELNAIHLPGSGGGSEEHEDILFIRDITKRHEAERSLRDAKKRFEDIALSTADWIWEVDKDGRYTFASGKVKQILGHEPEDILGKTPMMLMEEDEAERVEELFRIIISERWPIVDMEHWNITLEGKRVCLLTNGVPMYSKRGELLGFRGVSKDITRRKKAEEYYARRAEDLQKENVELQGSIEALLGRVEEERMAVETERTRLEAEGARIKALKDAECGAYPESDDDASGEGVLGPEGGEDDLTGTSVDPSDPADPPVEVPVIPDEDWGSIILYTSEQENAAYTDFRKRRQEGRPVLGITRTFPPRFQRRLGMELETVWLTTNRRKDHVCVDPTDITKLAIIIMEFFSRAKEGVVLFEGAEYALSLAGFKRLLHTIQIINDKISDTHGHLLMIFDIAVLGDQEGRMLLRECARPRDP